ncbi:MAG TPA: neutral zinc metallopeptidase [Casimicrobiaceae bacterium]|jgi:predicted metalloprotease|nr:neutral zinc metallopeptidase [Casimicrobiaceae bacterium]
MRWQDYRRSDNVEEGSSSGPSMFGGGLRLSGGAIILVVVVSLLLGKNPLEMLALLTGDGGGPVVQTQAPPTTTRAPASNDPQTEFVARVLGDTEDVWGGIFQQMGTRYQPPKLTLYHGQIASACGFSSAAAGPFYCPGDRKVYLDLTFFQELSQRFGAPGDFARAYVIAHEIGHHVQNQLGLMEAAQQKMANASERSRNDMSVRLELQADCLAGVWGHSSMQRNIIDAKDVESGMAAAAAVGDDRIQKQTRGYVVPEGFTHGSSAQRTKWFRTGLDSGDLRQCDTFGTRNL